MELELLDWLLFPPFIPGRVAIDNTTSRVPPDVFKNDSTIQNGVKEDTNDIDQFALRDFSDDRTWNPSRPSSPPVKGRFADVTIRPVSTWSSPWVVPSRVRFDPASAVVLCSRRLARRQSMFANGYHGRLNYRRSRRNRFSGISCRGAY